jgi:hypothetical protein
VRSLHIAARINARAARRLAQLIDDVLANSLLRIIAQTYKEFAQLFVSRQTTYKIIRNHGNGIIPAEPFV